MPVFSPKSKAVLGRDFALRAVEEVALVREYEAHRVPWHAHRGFQLFFALNGAAAYEMQTKPPRPVEIPGGHFLVVPPGLPHRGLQDACPPCELLFLVLPPAGGDMQLHSPLTRQEWGRALREFSRAPLTAQRIGQELTRAVAALAESVDQTDAGRNGDWHAARLRARSCEVVLETAVQLSNATSGAVHTAVAMAEKHLHDHFAEPLQMAEVAARARLSRTRLFALFRRTTGLTPNDYLQRLRIERARGLLTGTEQSITDIAFGTGYASSQYFSTVFRRFTGQTPQEFRASHATRKTALRARR